MISAAHGLKDIHEISGDFAFTKETGWNQSSSAVSTNELRQAELEIQLLAQMLIGSIFRIVQNAPTIITSGDCDHPHIFFGFFHMVITHTVC
jgi:hypothetical protein